MRQNGITELQKKHVQLEALRGGSNEVMARRDREGEEDSGQDAWTIPLPPTSQPHTQPHYPSQEQKRKRCLPVIEMATCFERQHPCPSDISHTHSDLQLSLPDRH